jgi:hypothetical protein
MAVDKRWRTALAWTIVGYALACGVALVLLGRQQIWLQRSPITLSASADALWVSQASVLHRLDAQGTRLDRVALAEMGVPEPLSHLHAVAADDLLLSTGEPTRLFRCTPSQRRCRQADAGYIERFGRFNLAVWIGANADGSRVVVSDNGAHRVAVLDAQGALLAHEGGQIGRFYFPAQPVWVGESDIWIAGADARRIERLEWHGSTLAFSGPVVATPAGDPVLAGRTWSLALAPLGGGLWWAVIQRDMLRPGGLFRFSETQGFDREAALPPGSDLTAVARLSDGLLVADLHGSVLWRLTLDGREARPFGDTVVAADLRETGREVERLASWQRVLTWALVGGPLLGIVLLWMMGEPASGPPPLRAVAGGVLGSRQRVTLQPRPRPAWWLWLEVSLGVVFAAALFMMWRVYAAPGMSERTTTGVRALVGLGMFMAVGTLVLAFWMARRQGTQRLEMEDGQIRWTIGDRLIAQASLADCWTDGRSLVIGERQVLLVHGQRPVFDAEEVGRHVIAAIPPQQRVSSGQLQMHLLRRAWKRRPLRTLAFAGLLGVLVLFVLADALGAFR